MLCPARPSRALAARRRDPARRAWQTSANPRDSTKGGCENKLHGDIVKKDLARKRDKMKESALFPYVRRYWRDVERTEWQPGYDRAADAVVA
jgi:hypothetical protein